MTSGLVMYRRAGHYPPLQRVPLVTCRLLQYLAVFWLDSRRRIPSVARWRDGNLLAPRISWWDSRAVWRLLLRSCPAVGHCLV